MNEITLSESKSFANRVLIISSFNKSDFPIFHSRADDIVELKNALTQLRQGKKEFTVSEGGTTFRFLLTRLSREIGTFIIHAKPQLLKRPQNSLYSLLETLGAKVKAYEDYVEIKCNGWDLPDLLEIDCSKTTQFASGVLLCAFNLEKDLYIDFVNYEQSKTYLEMTCTILKKSGMTIIPTPKGVCIKKNNQSINIPFAEPDMSSAFSIGSMGVIGPSLKLLSLPINSVQGDSVFVEILKQMNVSMEIETIDDENYNLIIHPSVDQLKAINVDLSQSPDLLPVLSGLCSLCKGTSKITGISHTRFKESDRIEKSRELVTKAGAIAKASTDELSITGGVDKTKSFEFDPDNDHRMAMAAAILKSHGVLIKILHPEVVNKSYPDFWLDAKVSP